LAQAYTCFRGRPPSRPFARELAAFLALVRPPTNAAALTIVSEGRRGAFQPLRSVATLTEAALVASGWATRYAANVW